MPSKIERFTQRARRALSLAQEEAERFHHNSIGTEHLLLGLIRADGGVAHQVFGDLIVDYGQLSSLVADLSPMGQRTSDKALDLSAETKHVLERAVVEARTMNHNYIGTEHLLLALVRQSKGAAIDILKRYGVSPAEVRRQTRRVLQESPVQTAHPPEPQAEPKPQVPLSEPLRRQAYPRLPHAHRRP
jgi:ATP-dependent Clp protease ATP-binding subunit ClpC